MILFEIESFLIFLLNDLEREGLFDLKTNCEFSIRDIIINDSTIIYMIISQEE